MPYSTCCNAHTNFPEIGICPECLEHCDWEDIEEAEIDEDITNEQKIDEFLINTITQQYD
jgi:hypothetical protein